MDSATVGLLLATAIGVAGTLAAAIFTQSRSDARELERLQAEERREDRRRAHDVSLEREARLFDHRRAAYLMVVEHYHRAQDWVGEQQVTPGPPADDDALVPFWRSLSEVDLYCEPETAKLARDLYDAVARLVFDHGPGQPDGRLGAAETAFRTFLDAVRAELGVPALDQRPRPGWWEQDSEGNPS